MFRKLREPVSPVTITVDGVAVTAESGESVAAALLRLDPPIARTTPARSSPRAPYCMMGVCFDCLAIVDGTPSTQTCRTQVQDGMRVERQHGARAIGQ
jgi:predicted molibdopterin-dependent oxidoreductase YjgC